jgi:hypothetical protein
MRLLHQVTAIMPIYLLYCQELKSQYRYFVGTAFFPKPKVPLIISTHYLQKSAFTVELGSGLCHQKRWNKGYYLKLKLIKTLIDFAPINMV